MFHWKKNINKKFEELGLREEQDPSGRISIVKSRVLAMPFVKTDDMADAYREIDDLLCKCYSGG